MDNKYEKAKKRLIELVGHACLCVSNSWVIPLILLVNICDLCLFECMHFVYFIRIYDNINDSFLSF